MESKKLEVRLLWREGRGMSDGILKGRVSHRGLQRLKAEELQRQEGRGVWIGLI